MITIELPFPPSVNTYWRNITIGKRARTLISERGRKYRQDVVGQVLVANPPKLHGPLACTLDLYPPCARRRDCDNFAKGLLDAMTHAGVYDDDSQIIDLRIRMHPKQPPGCVLVQLEQVEAPHYGYNQIDLLAG